MRVFRKLTVISSITKNTTQIITCSKISPITYSQWFSYKFDIESLFHWFSGVLTKSGISKLTGMNQSLVSQYANGIKKPSPKQVKKIEEAIHNFGEELLSIQF